MHAPTLDIKTQRAVLSVGILAQQEQRGEAGRGLHNIRSAVKTQRLRPPDSHRHQGSEANMRVSEHLTLRNAVSTVSTGKLETKRAWFSQNGTG